mmetsp:Transcript_9617/g.29802  ORF Transcript_9617/g.29802 Transcript_9617/m.29802 type:complete len:258 (+) Transcript_9617:319-1092(+)
MSPRSSEARATSRACEARCNAVRPSAIGASSRARARTSRPSTSVLPCLAATCRALSPSCVTLWRSDLPSRSICRACMLQAAAAKCSGEDPLAEVTVLSGTPQSISTLSTSRWPDVAAKCGAAEPFASRASALAREWRSSSTKPAWPLEIAKWSAVAPWPARASRSAPRCTSARAPSSEPAAAARCSAVRPSPARASREAPASVRASTQSPRPRERAMCSGVSPRRSLASRAARSAASARTTSTWPKPAARWRAETPW